MEPSLLTIGTMDVAQRENLFGAIMLAAWSLSSSAATLSHRANGTCLALRKRGSAFSFR